MKPNFVSGKGIFVGTNHYKLTSISCVAKMSHKHMYIQLFCICLFGQDHIYLCGICIITFQNVVKGSLLSKALANNNTGRLQQTTEARIPQVSNTCH